MPFSVKIGLACVAIALIAGSLGFSLARYSPTSNNSFISSFIEPPTEVKKPLLTYTIPNLATRAYSTSDIVVEKVIADHDTYTSYLFSYQTLNKKVTGQLNVPKNPEDGNQMKAIVMLRGYVPLAIFETGVGTRNGAAQLAQHGYLTLAPDFLGYGGSDPEPDDSWQARFEKPIIVIELIKTLREKPLTIPGSLAEDENETDLTLQTTQLGLWGHSNGGQIALTVLEVLGEPIPTTLWAPVTAPFPYSILFFSDESEDEGKGLRKWLAQFEEQYDVFDFSLTQHLDRIHAPLQLHHGTADDAALMAWSEEFVAKLKVENNRRQTKLEELVASGSAELANPPTDLQPIEFNYFTYPGADHNLQPGWNTVVERDLEFFAKHLP